MTGYLTDAKDRVIFAETPTLLQPIYGEPLPPPDMGKHRFLLGREGLYIEARNEVLEVRLKISDCRIQLPYGTVENTGVHLRHGKMPDDLLALAKAKAKQALPHEWAGYIVWDGHREQYDLFEPPVRYSSATQVSYANVLPGHLMPVMDVHSHGCLPAFFSDEDDRSDRAGFYIAAVLGECQRQAPTMISRVVVNGHFLDVPVAACFEQF